uniref:Uncharacterized protein n=1 Tax=Rhizophora mucronata TaxID=61149 RepID=A0A2P2P0R0_RHIMU
MSSYVLVFLPVFYNKLMVFMHLTSICGHV